MTNTTTLNTSNNTNNCGKLKYILRTKPKKYYCLNLRNIRNQQSKTNTNLNFQGGERENYKIILNNKGKRQKSEYLSGGGGGGGGGVEIDLCFSHRRCKSLVSSFPFILIHCFGSSINIFLLKCGGSKIILFFPPSFLSYFFFEGGGGGRWWNLLQPIPLFFSFYFCQCKIAKKSVWNAFVIVKVLLSGSRSVFIWAKMMKSYCLLKLETEKVEQLHTVAHATVLNKSVIYNNGMWHLWPTVAVCVFALFHVRNVGFTIKAVFYSLLCLNIKGSTLSVSPLHLLPGW